VGITGARAAPGDAGEIDSGVYDPGERPAGEDAPHPLLGLFHTRPGGAARRAGGISVSSDSFFDRKAAPRSHRQLRISRQPRSLRHRPVENRQ